MATGQAGQVLGALRALFRRKPEQRAVHARGVVLAGHFTAAPVAARLTRAAPMQGTAVPVLARFSGSSGLAFWPDFLPDARGLAVSLEVPGEGRCDIVAASLPRFPVATPEAFLELVRALRPGPGMAWRLPRFLLRHPRVLRSLPANAWSLARPPASYASMTYHAIHAFTWVTPYGSERHVRYRWMPEERRWLTWPRAVWRGARYLEVELRERLRRGAIRMHLQVQVARPGDSLADPSQPWPSSRDIVTVGTMELLSIVEDAGDVAFDPLRLVDGIVASADPVLHFRREVYALAAAERAGEVPGMPAELPDQDVPPPGLRH